MIDRFDKHTSTLPGIKEPVKRGRPPMFGEAMSAAERKARQRKEQDQRIEEQPSCEWRESDCMRVLSTKKYSGTELALSAWVRLGELKGFAA